MTIPITSVTAIFHLPECSCALSSGSGLFMHYLSQGSHQLSEAISIKIRAFQQRKWALREIESLSQSLAACRRPPELGPRSMR